MEKSEQLYKLFNRYLNNQCTLEETEVLMKYFHTDDQYFLYQLILGVLEKEEEDTDLLPLPPRVYIAIKKRIHPVAKVKSLWLQIPGVAAVAAAVFLIIAAGMLFYTLRRPIVSRNSQIVNQTDIAPGKNRALLTLADGRTIDLSDDKTGVLIDTGKLTYSDGSLVQNSVSVSSPGTQQRIILSTPKGGIYQVILSDGTKVWLNAASSLKFPSTFSTLAKNRIVELSGEAYFEVAKVVVKGNDKGSVSKDKSIRMPFIVVSRGQQVEVLGTHFNINSYNDETSVKTTLLEGSVRVSAMNNKKTSSLLQIPSATLKPGQQSVLTGTNRIQVIKADPELVVAWTKGLFYYKNTPMETVMKQIARWYNVDIAYADPSIKSQTFSGSVSRYDNVSKILGAIEFIEAAKFKVEGNKITVLKYE